MGPKIFFELGNEIEGRRLDPVFKTGKDLVGGINVHGRSSLRWLVNLEEEEEKEEEEEEERWGGWLMLIVDIRLKKSYFYEDPVESKSIPK